MRILIILSHVDCPLSIWEIFRRKNTPLGLRNKDGKPPKIYLTQEEIKEILSKEEKNGYIEKSQRPIRRGDLDVYKLTDDLGRQYLRDRGFSLP